MTEEGFEDGQPLSGHSGWAEFFRDFLGYSDAENPLLSREAARQYLKEVERKLENGENVGKYGEIAWGPGSGKTGIWFSLITEIEAVAYFGKS